MLKTVNRALRLLLLFEEADQEYRVGELALRLDVDKSIASRLAATLEEQGFLERVPESGAFRLGSELGRLGLLAMSGRHNLVSLARGPMGRLAAETGETAYLAVLEEEQAVNIAQVDGHHVVAVGDWVGWRTPPHCTANGKVLLAFMGHKKKIGNLSLKAFTERTITSMDELRLELEDVRRKGWAASVGEFEKGLHGVAAPVFDASEHCRAALSVAGPSYRMPRTRLRELAALCEQGAKEISTRLGSAQDER